MKPTEYRQGNTLFMIRPFEPFEALHVLADLQKVIGPVINGAAKSIDSKSLGKEVDIAFLAKIIGGVFAELPSKITGEQFEGLSRTLLRPDYISYSADGTEKGLVKLTETVIDENFTGRPLDLISLMIKVCKVNYLDFSKLLSIPAGWQEILESLTSIFQDSFQTNSNQ